MGGKIMQAINKLRYYVGLYYPLFLPRNAVAFAKDYFKGKQVMAIELGSDRGIHALSILKNLNIKKLFLVDPYEEYSAYRESEKLKTQGELSKCEKIARKRLSKYEPKIQWIKRYSDDAAKHFINDCFDFVYIDANHEYEYVKKDIELYYSKMRKGGILAGHDIVIFPGVMKAFCEFVVEHKIKFFRITKTDWYLIK